MGIRFLTAAAAVLLLHGCGGESFNSGFAGGTGGTGGTGGVATGGSTGDGGTLTGGRSGDPGGDAGSDAGANVDASIDAGPPPIVVVQASDTTLSRPPDPVASLTMPAVPNAGSAIIVGITCISDYGYDADAALAGDCTLSNGSVTDTAGNTYARVVQGQSLKSSHQGARSYIFIAHDISVSGASFGISVDPEGTSPVQAVAWGAIEVSGLRAPPSLDTSGITVVGATSPTSTTVTTDLATTQANELAVGVLSMRSNDTNMMITPETGWVSHHLHQDCTDANQNPPGHSMVSKVLSSTGEISHTWTHDAPTRGVGAVIATFKGAASN